MSQTHNKHDPTCLLQQLVMVGGMDASKCTNQYILRVILSLNARDTCKALVNRRCPSWTTTAVRTRVKRSGPTAVPR